MSFVDLFVVDVVAVVVDIAVVDPIAVVVVDDIFATQVIQNIEDDDEIPFSLPNPVATFLLLCVLN